MILTNLVLENTHVLIILKRRGATAARTTNKSIKTKNEREMKMD